MLNLTVRPKPQTVKSCLGVFELEALSPEKPQTRKALKGLKALNALNPKSPTDAGFFLWDSGFQKNLNATQGPSQDPPSTLE